MTADKRPTLASFDYDQAEADADARLAESHPTALVEHLEGGKWVVGYPLPGALVSLIKSLWVLAERDCVSEDGTPGQLKHKIKGGIEAAFTSGHESGWRSHMAFIGALRDGSEPSGMQFTDADELLDWVLADLQPQESLEDQDEMTLAEVLANLMERER